MLLLPDGALIAHVGDSRVYRVRGRRIDQLSFDHSLVWELVRRNHLTSEQARVSVPKNVITRSLGPEAEIEVDIEGPLPVELGDVFLLCSDGLSGPVEDTELGAFAANFHPRDACRYLVNLANLRGGLDNITVVIVRIGAVDRSRLGRDPAAARRRSRPATATTAGAGSIGSRDSSRGGSVRPARPSSRSICTASADCPIDEDLIIRLDELTRAAQEQAIEQAWSIDWTLLASLRRQQADARAARNDWVTFRKIGEIISLLGQGARFHRKAVSPTEGGEPRDRAAGLDRRVTPRAELIRPDRVPSSPGDPLDVDEPARSASFDALRRAPSPRSRAAGRWSRPST